MLLGGGLRSPSAFLVVITFSFLCALSYFTTLYHSHILSNMWTLKSLNEVLA